MTATYDPGNCDTIQLSFRLLNVHGFIPIRTRVFLETSDDHSGSAPIASTPPSNTDARIPLTAPFSHRRGLLTFETFLDYTNIASEDLEEAISKLQFHYEIRDCTGSGTSFYTYDFSNIISSKKWMYFIKNIDVL